ncbi:MAG: sensor histidine kinase [Actinomycetota bacterium]|nr:sensor histidine kinase [Actinomycetota bacterium]
MTGTRVGRRPTWIFIAVGLAGVAVALQAEYFSIRAAATENHMLDFAVGVTYLAAGLITWWYRPANRIGPLMLAFAFAWFIGNLYGSGVPFLVSVANGFEGTNAIFMVWLILAYPTGRLATRLERAAVVVTALVTVVTGVIVVLTFDPQRFGCLDCREAGPALFPSFRVWHAASQASDRAAFVLAVIVLVALVRRWRRASPIERSDLLPLWIVTVILAVDYSVEGFTSNAGPNDAFANFLIELQKVGQLLIPILFMWGLLKRRMARAAVGDLVVELEGPVSAGGMRDALARTLHDASLRIVFPANADEDTWIDEDGRAVDLPADPSAVTVIHRDGEPVAALLHDPALVEHQELLRAAGAAAGMAIENEHLQAEVRAQLQEVRASRARIVAAGDTERRRVERDLHDGAQQRLLTLSLALHAARRQADTTADPALAETLRLAADELSLALEELRELARGIHPAILTEEGIGPALESLASRASVPVSLVGVPEERLPSAVEAAAYFVVSEALANVTKYAKATAVVVRLARDNGHLRVEVRDDGVGGADPANGSGLRGLQDRVAAINGRLVIDSPPGSGTSVLADLPCNGDSRVDAAL